MIQQKFRLVIARWKGRPYLVRGSEDFKGNEGDEGDGGHEADLDADRLCADVVRVAEARDDAREIRRIGAVRPAHRVVSVGANTSRRKYDILKK